MTRHDNKESLSNIVKKKIKYVEREGVYHYLTRENDPALYYEVMPPRIPAPDDDDDDDNGWFCSCKGFFYRKECKHVKHIKQIEQLAKDGVPVDIIMRAKLF